MPRKRRILLYFGLCLAVMGLLWLAGGGTPPGLRRGTQQGPLAPGGEEEPLSLDGQWMALEEDNLPSLEEPRAMQVMGRPVYLVWASEDLIAFHRKDPHPRGCLVVWAAAERRFGSIKE